MFFYNDVYYMIDIEFNELIKDSYDKETDEEWNEYPVKLAEFIVKLYEN